MSDIPSGLPFFDVVFAQRACREYSNEPVDDATIELVLRAATHAPSAENKQPWEFIVVRDPAAQTVIHDLTEAAWVNTGRAFSEERLPPELLKEVDFGIAGGGYRTAPVLVVACVNLDRGMQVTAGSSIFPCVQNMLLAANALGLGSALTTLGAQPTNEMRDLLALPETVLPMAIVPLGVPARPLGPPRRNPVTDHMHRDRYLSNW